MTAPLSDDAYRQQVRDLPRPTLEQRVEFAVHVARAHSWYKHLDLLRGGEVVVFLAADAGEGYPDAAPRLHHSWRTTREYRARFGFLDFLWRFPDEPAWARDVAQEVAGMTVVGLTALDGQADPGLPESLRRAAGLRIYPYAHYDLDPYEWRSLHGEDLERLVAEHDAHPHREALGRWHALDAALDACGEALPDDELDAVLDRVYGPEGGEAPALSPGQQRFVEAWHALDALRQELEEGEVLRIHAAVEALMGWLERT